MYIDVIYSPQYFFNLEVKVFPLNDSCSTQQFKSVTERFSVVQCIFGKIVRLRLNIFNNIYLFYCLLIYTKQLLKLNHNLNSTTYISKMQCNALQQCTLYIFFYYLIKLPDVAVPGILYKVKALTNLQPFDQIPCDSYITWNNIFKFKDCLLIPLKPSEKCESYHYRAEQYIF